MNLKFKKYFVSLLLPLVILELRSTNSDIKKKLYIIDCFKNILRCLFPGGQRLTNLGKPFKVVKPTLIRLRTWRDSKSSFFKRLIIEYVYFHVLRAISTFTAKYYLSKLDPDTVNAKLFSNEPTMTTEQYRTAYDWLRRKDNVITSAKNGSTS
ncbi:hypothetical protein BpHYR1_010324 [Brachionus plicatilis]|uniref:Uncharacterized protein n=1 Tax=Brachionus plicatilis TaxID=10195 RepID=A0A3M7Q2G1_BRAPC|nr:hypothetical protein BpHYR1_010324 [Brachionus plicatilis]